MPSKPAMPIQRLALACAASAIALITAVCPAAAGDRLLATGGITEIEGSAGTKVWLDGPLDHTWLADVTLRASEANQLGILGFGGDRGGYHLLAEGSLGVFLTDHLIAGAEYRQKPSNLSVFREEDFEDVFLAYFPVKYLAVTGAFASLGNIADKPDQRGWYLSLQGSW